jgi:hypothetical protein
VRMLACICTTVGCARASVGVAVAVCARAGVFVGGCDCFNACFSLSKPTHLVLTSTAHQPVCSHASFLQLADRLVGIYKTDNCTKTVTINPHLMVGQAPAASAPGPVKIHANAVANKPQTAPLQAGNV